MIHVCDAPEMVYDTRHDNGWIPPRQERRARCLTCGWQGPWTVIGE